MADVTIIPPPQVQNVSAGGQQAQSATDTNTHQTNLPPGTLVSGTITGKDAAGNYLLKSPQGTFTLQSATPLTYNSDVEVRIGASNQGALSARIVSVNGEPFSEFSAPAPEESDSVSASLLAPPAAPASDVPDTTAATVRAVIVASPPAAGQAANANFVPGSAVTLRVPESDAPIVTEQAQTEVTDNSPPTASISNSATAAVQPQLTAETIQPAALQPTASVPAPASPATGTLQAVTTAAPVETDVAAAQAVSQVTAPQAVETETPQAQTPAASAAQSNTPEANTPQPNSPQAPSAPASAFYSVYAKQSAGTSPAPSIPAPPSSAPTATPNTNASQNTLPAQVVSTDENGNVTLATSLGNLTVKPTVATPVTFTPGTTIALELLTAEGAQESLAPASLSELAGSWQSLKDIVAQQDTSASTSLLARLPQMGPDFLSESTAFITSLLQGNTRKLLGDDTINNLKQNGRADLLEKFSAEAAALSSGSTTQSARQTSGWQTLFLPFVYQESLQQARIYVKRDNQKKDRANPKATDDTRFVVEVDMSEMGPMQMDGLVRKNDKAIAFDLVIRSHNAFLPEDQSAILALYNNAAQLTGFRGALAFQITRDFPVKPLEEAASNEVHSITA